MAQFNLQRSSTQIRLSIIAHATAALALLIYLEPAWLACLSALLVALLALHDYRAVSRLQGSVLSLDPAGAAIGFGSCAQPYFYTKYKVYACRWFAILKLIDERQPRTLILNYDSVDNPGSYRQLRHALLVMEPSHAA